MLDTAECTAKIGSPTRGVFRLRSPYALTQGNLVLVHEEEYSEADVRDALLEQLGTDAVLALMALDTMAISSLEVWGCDLDVFLSPFAGTEEKVKILRILAGACTSHKQSFRFVGSSRRLELVHH